MSNTVLGSGLRVHNQQNMTATVRIPLTLLLSSRNTTCFRFINNLQTNPAPPPSLSSSSPALPTTETAIMQQMSRTLIKQCKNSTQTAAHMTPLSPKLNVSGAEPGETAERLTGDVESIAAAGAALARCVDVDSSELSHRDHCCFFYGAARARSRPLSSQADRTIGAQRSALPTLLLLQLSALSQ